IQQSHPGMVVYRELLGRMDRAGRVAHCWWQLRKDANIASILPRSSGPIANGLGRYDPEGLIFLGELQAEDGTRRLVAVEITYQTASLNFEIFVIEPAGALTPLRIVRHLDERDFTDVHAGPSQGLNITDVWAGWATVKIYPGHVQPSDPSKFEARVMIGPWG